MRTGSLLALAALAALMTYAFRQARGVEVSLMADASAPGPGEPAEAWRPGETAGPYPGAAVLPGDPSVRH